MLKSGILNPHVLSLIARVRHTNYLVIADRGFPYWPGIETVDLSLVDDLPRVIEVVKAIVPCWSFRNAYMACEFLEHNDATDREHMERALGGVAISLEPHENAFKLRVPQAVGIIRTGDTMQYANIILESA